MSQFNDLEPRRRQRVDIAETTGFRIAATIVGAVVAFGGTLALLAVIGVFPNRSSQTLTSLVFGVSASAVFILAGVGMLLFGLRLPGAGARLGGIALLVFAFVFNWIAFGPGEREFVGTVSLGGIFEHSTATSELSGRIVFGIVAAAMDVLIVYGLIAGRSRRR